MEVVELVEAIDKVFEPVDNTSTQENDEFEESLESILSDKEYVKAFENYYSGEMK